MPHFLFFFFNNTATPEISPLSLPDALPISRGAADLRGACLGGRPVASGDHDVTSTVGVELSHLTAEAAGPADDHRSEEHTSELQSQSNLVCRLLLEKKNPILRIRLHQRTLA